MSEQNVEENCYGDQDVRATDGITNNNIKISFPSAVITF